MSIPNTTPTPNELYNGEMKKMSDTELRVVLLVTRATLGWVIDQKTGMRKEEDWISHSQIVKRTGRSSRAISKAVNTCVKKGWIETRTKAGRLLNTAHQRKMYGKKIFYRLGRIFLDKITIENNAMAKRPSQKVRTTIALNDTRPSQKVRTTKRYSYKKILLQNNIVDRKNIKKRKENKVHLLVDYFFRLKGWDKLPKTEYKKRNIVYGRFAKEAKELMTLAGDNLAKAKKATDIVSRWAKAQELSWNIGTIIKNWFGLDTLQTEKKKKCYYKDMRAYERNGRWYVIEKNGQHSEFAGDKKELMWK